MSYHCTMQNVLQKMRRVSFLVIVCLTILASLSPFGLAQETQAMDTGRAYLTQRIKQAPDQTPQRTAQPALQTAAQPATQTEAALQTEATLQTEAATPAKNQAPLVIIYIHGLQWSDLDPVKTPTLYRLAETSAIANMSAPYNDLYGLAASDPRIDLRILAPEATMERYDRQLADLLQQFDSTQVVAIVSAPIFNNDWATCEFTPVVICGPGFFGFASSETTRRVGLVTGDNLIALAKQLDETGGQQAVDAWGRMLISCYPADNLEKQLAQLEHERIRTEAIAANKATMGLLFLALVFVAFGFSLLLLIIGQADKKGSRGFMIPLVRALWLLALSGPPATFLMFIFIPQQPNALQLTLICFAWVVGIALAALFVGNQTKWINSLFFLLLISIVVILAGQLFGGPLALPGYLTYDITDGSRYYGMGNEHAAIVFGAWFAFSGLLINRFPRARGMTAFRKWGFLAGSALLLFIAVNPWMGASLRPLTWGTFGVMLLWWLFNERRLRWWFIPIMLLLSAVLAISVLYIEVSLNAFSHMSEYRLLLADKDLLAMLAEVLNSAWQTSAYNMSRFMPLPIILFLLVAATFFIILGIVKPGSYREFWSRNKTFGAVYLVSFFIAFISFVLEDSGLSTPAFFLIYPISGFIWLVCDMHRWHLNELVESGEPITVRQLMRRALELETYRSVFSPYGRLGTLRLGAEAENLSSDEVRTSGKHPNETSGKHPSETSERIANGIHFDTAPNSDPSSKITATDEKNG